MSDYPSSSVACIGPVLACISPTSLCAPISSPVWVGGNRFGASTGTWPAASTGIFWQFLVDQPMIVKTIAWGNGATLGGNVDVGVYDRSGTRIVSKGPTAQSGTSTIQLVDMTASVTGTASPVLLPGIYFAAMCATTNTQTFLSQSLNLQLQITSGVRIQASLTSGTLPATMTGVNPTAGFFPWMSLTTSTVI